ncbi:leukotriene C4 synthase, gene 2 L homeolog isoform X1 [Xenopus laevis]|uniref:Leukotriene C4 synthase, gene 2 L homeolog isoform X1 n=1 Tax=Xenopus laevis TaxID=8355 RepID=A0A8J1MHD1_XENLA|nr:leukotriene C4 synthase, gene 2 L homeolog isoform X1 [Xenopus laevis]
MPHHIVLLGAVTLLGVLEQAYFALQVIAARRKYSVSPPSTSGPPEFDRIFRAQVNCTEYFPMFIAVLWLAGIFFHQGTSLRQHFRGGMPPSILRNTGDSKFTSPPVLVSALTQRRGCTL